MFRFLVILVAFLVSVGSVSAQAKPEFKLGFKALASQIPDVVGEALENEHWNDNGDSIQQTSKGLMAWRKADNFTCFTDGSHSWINGPFGIQDRTNGERFDWEAAISALPAPTPLIRPDPIKATSNGVALTVNSVTKASKLGFYTATTGNTFVIVDITLENLSRPRLSYSMAYLKLKSNDGYSYRANHRSLEKELQMDTIGPGEIGRGRVSFEVPSNAKGLTFIWETEALSRPETTIQVKLE